jgi:hypothetical protein
MTPLKREPEHRYCWTNPGWRAGAPGTFAVVIGVSRYKHLSPTDQPLAPETFGLPQLTVSALSAYRFFLWLCNDYLFEPRYGGSSLAKCWLLLAPSDLELDPKLAPGLAECAIEPTLESCSAAVEEWYAEMKSLPRQSAEKSRGIFFFSGHGLELTPQHPVLLPSDFLRPPAWSPTSRTIDAGGIRRGLSTLSVPEQFFFLDACRNDHQKLRGYAAKGVSILEQPSEIHRINPNVVSPILFSTSPGSRAYQPRDPERGVSFYTSAVLDGLLGSPDVRIRRDRMPLPSIHIYDLQDYAHRRVLELLRNLGATEKQSVRLGGESENTAVTLRREPASAYANRPPPGPALTDRHGSFISHGPFSGREIREMGYTQAYREVFHSESMRWIWKGAQLFRLDEGRELAPDDYRVNTVAAGKGTETFHVELEVPSGPVGHILHLSDWDGVRNFARLLPPIKSAPGNWQRYEIEIDLKSVESAFLRPITRLEVYPRPDEEDCDSLLPLLDAWRSNTVPTLEEGILETVRVAASPLVEMAAIAMLKWQPRNYEGARKLHSLLRTARETPDAQILAMEFNLRWGQDQDPLAIAEYLRTIRRLELPHFSESIGYLWAQLQMLQGSQGNVTELRNLAKDFKVKLGRVIQTLTPDNLLTSLFDETNSMDLVRLMRFGRVEASLITGSGSSGSSLPIAPAVGPALERWESAGA